jgi:hypothetical protein
MKLHNKHVRLPDGEVGVVVASGLDGLVVVTDGKIVNTLEKDITVIPAPAAAPLPEPVRTAQAPIQTHHPLDEEPQFPARPQGLSVLVSNKWSTPQ